MNVSVLVASYGDLAWADQATCAILSAVAEKPHEVIYRHANEGLAECRNALAAMATGDWLCFLDADDELEPGYLAAMERALWTYTHPAGESLPEFGPEPLAPALLVPAVRYDDAAAAVIPDWGRPLEDVNCAVIGTLVARDLFNHVGGFRDWPYAEDWALWLACSRLDAVLVPVPDAVYRAHSTAAGRNVRDPSANLRTYQAIRAEHLANKEPT